MARLLDEMQDSEDAGNEETESIDLLDDFLALCPSGPESRWALGQRAIGYEIRGFRDPESGDLMAAYRDYVALERYASEVGSDVLLGAARILMKWGDPGSAQEIERLCHKAFDVFPSGQAKCLLGATKLHFDDDRKAALELYGEAADMGVVMALQLKARVEWLMAKPLAAFTTTYRFVVERRRAGVLERPFSRNKPDP
jgi:hypothetical protein